MTSIVKWWQTNGDKVTAVLTAIQSAVVAVAPSVITAIFGTTAGKYVLAASALYTAIHSIFIPDAVPTPAATANKQ